jgi:hypothetical protein
MGMAGCGSGAFLTLDRGVQKGLTSVLELLELQTK